MSLRKDIRGALSPILIVVVVIVIAGIGFAGYKVMNNKKSNDTASNTALPAEVKEQIDEECMKQYNDKDLCKFMSNWEASAEYKATFASVGADGTKSLTKIEASGDNTSSVMLEGDKETGAFITLNKTSYMKDYEKGVWYKLPAAQAPAASETNPVSELKIDEQENTTEEAKNTTTYKKIGKEACGNKSCFKYQVIDTADTETIESFVWFGDDDYKLARWTTKSKDGSSSDSTFSYEKVTISEPSPVEEYPTFDPNSLPQ